MYLLAFESSCDETAAAVIEAEGNRLRILSDIVASSADVHRLFGGVVPEIASRAHTEVISRITEEALEKSGISLEKIGAVAVTSHPGLIGALLVGVNFAKSLALPRGIPLVPVDHIRGHIAAAYFGAEPPKPPFLALVVSGGHTSLYRMTDYNTPVLIGTTRDDAMGESFDKVGRLVGLPYPAGAGFDALATEGFLRACGKTPDPARNGEDERVADAFAAFPSTDAARSMPLPSPALSGDTLDFSFSGPKTAAVNLLHRYAQNQTEPDRALFAAAYTYTAVHAAVEKVALTLTRYPGEELVLSGGVAANSHLRGQLRALCRRRGVRIHIPPRSLCGDNGAMIAAAGYYAYLAGERGGSDLNASAADMV